MVIRSAHAPTRLPYASLQKENNPSVVSSRCAPTVVPIVIASNFPVTAPLQHQIHLQHHFQMEVQVTAGFSSCLEMARLGHASTSTPKRIFQELSKLGEMVRWVDEHRTSKCCSPCGEEMEQAVLVKRPQETRQAQYETVPQARGGQSHFGCPCCCQEWFAGSSSCCCPSPSAC
ncbi:hypothetical protein V1515DRAFT_604634 [Lipomyces mesembrius]